MKSNIVWKRIGLFLSGAVMMCLLGGCTSNNADADYGNVSDVVEDSSANKADNENQYPEAGEEQPQISTNISSESPQAAADVSSESSQASPSGSNEPSTASSNEKDKMQSLSLEESYRAVLLDNGEFISTDLQNKKLNLKSIKEVVTDDDSISVAANQFAVIDLDGDGVEEVVLWLQINGISDYGFEILKIKEGAVYGYTLPYREFMELKTDGTFLFSGGAADTGIGRLKFSENGYTVDKLHYSESEYDSNNELKIQYFVNGEACSEEDFNDAMRIQEELADVRWYDL